jgi:hypothetical protein
MTPASGSVSSAPLRESAALGGRPPPRRDPFSRLAGRTLPLDVVLVVDVLDVLRYAWVLKTPMLDGGRLRASVDFAKLPLAGCGI